MKSQIRPALTVLLTLTILTGVLYPAVVTAIAKISMPHQSEGSVITRQGRAIGSELIGQGFTDPKYFWGRPSATSPVPYTAFDAKAGTCASGSNAGPSNPALADAMKTRVEALHAADPSNTLPVPVDLVTTSASGLDPHISVAGAEFQLSRVARARNLPVEELRTLVQTHTEDRTFRILGEPRVHVLKLNLALDELGRR